MDKKTIIAIAVVILTLGVGILIASSDTKEVRISKGDANVKREDAYSKGSVGSKVEIVEFSDFQCPACKNSAGEMKKVMETYKDNVVFYYRHFPLPQHKLAIDAAKAAEAAGVQGKFWEMHDMIFANQENLEEGSFSKFAQDLGLDEAKYKKDFSDAKTKSTVLKDKDEGTTLGVNSTPTFYLNGEKVENIRTFEEWKTEIDSRLSENPKP